MKKQAKGITLIALVITIIVLLILATVAINLSLGENGIFVKAKKAKEKTEKEEESEIIKLAYTDILTDNIVEGKEITSNLLQEKINQTKEANVEEVNEIPEGAIFVENGITEGTICKVTMKYVYYIYLNNKPSKKFYLELYGYKDEECTEQIKIDTITLYYGNEKYFEDWLYSEYNTQLTDISESYAMRGNLMEYTYDFHYNGRSYSFQVYFDSTGEIRESDDTLLSQGKILKFLGWDEN